MELPGSLLGTVPDLSGSWGCSLGTDEVVDPGAKVRKRSLDVSALSVTGTQEAGVENEQNPRSALEEKSGEHNPDPEEDLEARYDRHGGVIVFLDEGSNLVA